MSLTGFIFFLIHALSHTTDALTFLPCGSLAHLSVRLFGVVLLHRKRGREQNTLLTCLKLLSDVAHENLQFSHLVAI